MTEPKTDRILVVDDEELVAKVLELHLKEAGYPVDCARDGVEGLELLAANPYSLVLLDISMPRMNGVEVLERIAAMGSDAAVVMMSGHGSEKLAVLCMKSGAIDYMTKPFDLGDVLQRVEQALSNRRTLLEKRRLEREKNDFVSMLSHDMKNPLTAVVGSIDLVREGRLGAVNAEQMEYLQSAVDSCNEVVAMIDNLLDIHRFEAGRMQLSISPCDPGDILAALLTRFGLLAAREGIRLRGELDSELPWVAIDRNAFSRTVGNLLGNAIKFTPEGGEVVLSCCSLTADAVCGLAIPPYAMGEGERERLGSGDRYLLVTVRDTGEGVPAEDQERIFQRFVQSRRSGKNYGGAGLGLAYCKLTVESFGGAIWVVSEPGEGSEFNLLLPALAPGRDDG